MPSSFQKAVVAYQQLAELIVDAKIDQSAAAAALKSLAFDFEKLPLFKTSLNMYGYLGEFIVKYHNEEDLVFASFVITWCWFLKERSVVVNDAIQQMLVPLMNIYHRTALSQFIVDDYLKTMK